MRIWITGCARSGTTLLRRLFYAFEGVEVINCEISLEELISYGTSEGVLVGKRNKWSLLSYTLESNEESKALDLVLEHDVQIVNMLRDGRDVIETRAQATPERWLASIDAYWRLKERIALAIMYERLVMEPDKVQENIAEQFGLIPTARFSEYPAFVPDAGLWETPRYKPRPIDTAQIGKDYDWHKIVLQKHWARFEEACDWYQELLEE